MRTILFTALLIFLGAPAKSQIKTDSLFLFYPFTGNAHDYSGDSLHGQVFGATLVQDRFGIDSSAYSFDGTNDYIVVPDTSLIKTPTFPFSVSLWVKIYQYNTKVISLFKSCDSQSHYCGYSVNYTSTGAITTGYANGGIVSTYNRKTRHTNQTLSLNQWHHVLVSFNSASSIDVYIDGNATTGYYSGGANSLGYVAAPGVIGVNDAPSGLYYHDGLIDDIRVWKDTANINDAKFLFFESPCASTISLYDTIVHFDSVAVFDTIPVFDTITITQNLTVVDTLLINLPIDISENEKSKILVYPNPTTDVLVLDVGAINKKIAFIALTDPAGRQVVYSPFKEDMLEIDLNNLGSKGQYTLTLIDASGGILFTRKIILQ